MYLIVGLGNPEPEYSMTRHNMGFDVINSISKKYDIPVTKNGFKGIYGIGEIENKKVILLKPQTYMNESGKSIIEVKEFYKIPLENIIIIYDDIDLEVGVVKIRKKGGAGTHNGMKSVVEYLKSGEFIHIRIGTGKPEFKELLIPHVIGKLDEKTYNLYKPSIEKATLAIPEILKNGIDKAMNKFN